MAITVGNNIASLRARRKLEESSTLLGQIFERLSSGQRINSASDDAAGLSVSTSLNSHARIISQAIRNASDGISALSIAEGAMRELTSIVTRISELAEQSANGTYSSSQRAPLNTEAQALRNEFNRIIETTKFNGISLLNGSTSGITLQVGTDSSANSRIVAGQGYVLREMIGDGTITASGTYSSSNSVDAFGSADLNGDGFVDIVTGGVGSATYSVRLGNGDGTFKAENAVGATGSRSILLADMNKDGRADLVRFDANYGAIYYMPGQGDGTFGSNVTIANTSSWIDQSYGVDLNGDGNLDYVGIMNNATGSSFYSILGNGNGTFKVPVTYSLSYYLAGSTLGDFDSDGKLDAVIYSDVSAGNDTHQFFKGNGDGSFQAGVTVTYVASADQQWDVNSADVNGDGKLDIISTGSSGAGIPWVGISLGNGNGTFKATYTGLTTSFNLYDATTADMNGDGNVDIIASGGGTVVVALGNGDGTFLAGVTKASGISQTTRLDGLSTTDLNGDGIKDLLVGGSTANSFAVMLGTGAVSYTLSAFSIATRSDALATLDTMRTKLETIDASLGLLGAAQSRLDVAVRSLEQARLTTLQAAARITDIDVAEESSQLVRLSILQKAATAVLAQANQEPQLALKLLQS